jgi:hypothetical protein
MPWSLALVHAHTMPTADIDDVARKLSLYRLCYETSLTPTIVLTEDGKVLYVNRAAKDLPGELIASLAGGADCGVFDVTRFREELARCGRAQAEVTSRSIAVALDGKRHGYQIVVQVRDVTGFRDALAKLDTLKSFVRRAPVVCLS